MEKSHDSIIFARRAYFLYDGVRYANQHLGAGGFTELIVEFGLVEGYAGPLPEVTACRTDLDTGSQWSEACEVQPTADGIRAIIGLWQPTGDPDGGATMTFSCRGREVARITYNTTAPSREGEINFAE